MKKITRNILNWLMEFLPMYQMKLHLTMGGKVKEYDASYGQDWFLPRMKRKVSVWNQDALNCKADPSLDYAYYVRIK